MKRPNKEGRIFRAAMLMLSLFVLTSCSMLKPAPPVVMPESRAIYLEAGKPTPLTGWLLSESALAKLLEKAESCK